jgi:hypothetical protein
MEIATLTRGETPSSYNYHLETKNKRYRVYRTRGYHYINYDDNKMPVYFNEYLFPQFAEIPMCISTNDYGETCWDMVHQYRQTAGGAAAPYEIIV